MPSRPPRSCPRCSQPVTVGQPCPRCQKTTRREVDRERGTATQRGYGTQHRWFRVNVLRRDPVCTCPGCPRCKGTPCGMIATEADHYPRSRRELEAEGLNPNEARYGRGLCKPCHSHHTTQAQPGGWNRR